MGRWTRVEALKAAASEKAKHADSAILLQASQKVPLTVCSSASHNLKNLNVHKLVSTTPGGTSGIPLGSEKEGKAPRRRVSPAYSPHCGREHQLQGAA